MPKRHTGRAGPGSVALIIALLAGAAAAAEPALDWEAWVHRRGGESVPPVMPTEAFTLPPGHYWDINTPDGLQLWCTTNTGAPIIIGPDGLPEDLEAVRCGGLYRDPPPPAPRSRAGMIAA